MEEIQITQLFEIETQIAREQRELAVSPPPPPPPPTQPQRGFLLGLSKAYIGHPPARPVQIFPLGRFELFSICTSPACTCYPLLMSTPLCFGATDAHLQACEEQSDGTAH